MIRLADRELNTKYGQFTEVLYYDGQRESIALVMGDVRGGIDVLCRIHSACIGGHVFPPPWAEFLNHELHRMGYRFEIFAARYIRIRYFPFFRRGNF